MLGRDSPRMLGFSSELAEEGGEGAVDRGQGLRLCHIPEVPARYSDPPPCPDFRAEASVKEIESLRSLYFPHARKICRMWRPCLSRVISHLLDKVCTTHVMSTMRAAWASSFISRVVVRTTSFAKR